MHLIYCQFINLFSVGFVLYLEAEQTKFDYMELINKVCIWVLSTNQSAHEFEKCFREWHCFYKKKAIFLPGGQILKFFHFFPLFM